MACEIPHFYSNKKYIGINIQDVPRGQRTYFYTGGKGIDGCLHHLSNINSVCGCILTLTHFLAKKAGINHRMFKQQPEQLEITAGSSTSGGGDEGLKGLLDASFRSVANTVTTEAAKTNYKIKALEDKVDSLERALAAGKAAELKDLLERVKIALDELNRKLRYS